MRKRPLGCSKKTMGIVMPGQSLSHGAGLVLQGCDPTALGVLGPGETKNRAPSCLNITQKIRDWHTTWEKKTWNCRVLKFFFGGFFRHRWWRETVWNPAVLWATMSWRATNLELSVLRNQSGAPWSKKLSIAGCRSLTVGLFKSV